MLTNEIVNAEMQRDRVLVRSQILAVTQPLALKSLQFPLRTDRANTFGKMAGTPTALRNASSKNQHS